MELINRDISPTRLFLIDGIGAVISAIMLAIVLPQLHALIGMPIPILKYLGFAASIFALYSLSCFWIKPIQWRALLRVIGMINIMYCAVSLGLVFYYYPQLTKLGLAYFLIEKLIVFPLAMIEIRASIR